MKISHFAAAVTGALLFSTVGHSAQVTPEGLTGTITPANGPTALVDTFPKLNWTTNYPLKPPIPPTPLPTNFRVKVRVIGQGVTGSNSPGTFFFAPTHATMSINASSFASVFYGINPEVNSAKIIELANMLGSTYSDNIVQKGSVMNFGGYWQMGGDSGTHYKSNDGTNHIRFLVKGDTPPSCVPEYNEPTLESFLRPYLDTTGKVDIGDMDVIVFMELTHTAAQQSQPGYDLQDMVLLVTFEPIK